MKAWTDYPFTWLGDTAGQKAPVREIEVLSYDDDKYCRIKVCGGEDEIKAGYIYQREGRYGEVPPITRRQLAMLVHNATTTAELATLREKAAEADELQKDAELGKCIRVKFRLMKGSTAVRFLGCLGVNEPEGGFDWSKTILELIDAAIAQEQTK